MVEDKKGVKEVSEALDMLLDGVERLLVEVKDGKKIIDEIKDLDLAEGVQLAMQVMMRLPALLGAMKSEVE